MSLKRKKVEGYGNPLTFLKEHGGFFNDFIIRKKKRRLITSPSNS
jgi:hypothetical protein